MSNAIALKQLAWVLPALGSFLAGLTLAWHHPLWPVAMCLAFALWCALAAWRPNAWLLVVPACLPWLNFSPWTGWLVFEEFDLLLLGALAAGYSRLAFAPQPDHETKNSSVSWVPVSLWTLLAVAGLVALYRGIADAGGLQFDWFAGYTDALNSLRVFKSLGFALLFVPLLASAQALPPVRAGQLLAWGMVLGLLQVTLAVLWERAAFPGVFDFSAHYRTVALFWEMHVGGAAIDAYLALSTPFAVWALMQARRPLAWAGAASLALLTAYACLTTFSRGVYGAVLGSLVILGVLLLAQKQSRRVQSPSLGALQSPRFAGWRPKASLLLVLTLFAEVGMVLGAGSFMTKRLDTADRDLDSRLAHWQHGLALAQQPSEWLLGIGLGRFPSHYAKQVPRGEFSGSVTSGDGFVTLRGPSTRKSLAGAYALTQQVEHVPSGPQWVSLQVRAQQRTDAYISLCERHLLYDGNCQDAFVRLPPSTQTWQTLRLPLRGAPLNGGPQYAPRSHMLSLAIANAGGVTDVDNVKLIGADGVSSIENGDFSHGLAHWFPAAQSYFVPWHTDNLFLEILVERGWLGLVLWLMVIHYALWHMVCGRAKSHGMSPFLTASVCGVLLVGLVSSVMDVPRVAFLMYLLALLCTPFRTRHA